MPRCSTANFPRCTHGFAAGDGGGQHSNWRTPGLNSMQFPINLEVWSISNSIQNNCDWFWISSISVLIGFDVRWFRFSFISILINSDFNSTWCWLVLSSVNVGVHLDPRKIQTKHSKTHQPDMKQVLTSNAKAFGSNSCRWISSISSFYDLI